MIVSSSNTLKTFICSKISRSLAHLTADVQALITAVESMVRDLGDLHDVVNQISGQQQTLVTVLALSSSGGGGGYYGRDMWKREVLVEDDEIEEEVDIWGIWGKAVKHIGS